MLNRVCISDGSRDALIQWITTQRQSGPFTVVDVGGSITGWTSEFVDAICDINPPENPSKRDVLVFKMNINDPYIWE